MEKPIFPVPTQEEIETAITVLKRDERITSKGYGLPRESSLGDPKLRAEILNIGRDKYLQEQLYTALRYLENVTPTKKATHFQVDSYRWKHRVERWGHLQGFQGYVANGVFILAAIMKGFPIQGIGNPIVGISTASAKALDR